MSRYQKIIAAEADKLNIEVDPRHVEGWMLLQHGTLSHLDIATFRRFVRHTAAVEASHPGQSETLAQTFSL